METNKTLNIAGMSCSSCERIISKVVEAEGGKVHSINAQTGAAVIDYPEESLEKIKNAIAASGYTVLDSLGKTVAVEPFEAEIKLFITKLLDGEKELQTERKILKMSLLSTIALFAIGFFFFIMFWKGLPGIGAKTPFLFYTGISSVVVVAAMAHYHSHRLQFTCMEGMMTGMTIGMMAGFLFGGVVGATNGMFVGSVFGMAVGIITGAYCGKCCGIMGVMEGMMAGLMGGTMGAMLTIMLLADNLLLFMPILVISCVAILAGLTYMIYNTAGKRASAQLTSFSNFFMVVLLLSVVTAMLMLYGPKGPVTI